MASKGSKMMEEPTGGQVAPTMAFMNKSPMKGGLTWAQCELVKIDSDEASASYSGGGQGDVPTVRGAAIIQDGAHVRWQLRIVKKLGSSLMRIGVQHPAVRVGTNWNDKTSRDKCWYMDSNGDMYNGNTIVNETDSHFTSNSTIEVNLGFQRMSFSIDGKEVGAQIHGVSGEVQLACQFFSKGDRVKLLDQVVPEDEDEAELDNLEEQYQARRRREDEVQEERRRRWAIEDEARRREEELEAAEAAQAAAARERERARQAFQAEADAEAEGGGGQWRGPWHTGSDAVAVSDGQACHVAMAAESCGAASAGQVGSADLALMMTQSSEDAAHAPIQDAGPEGAAAAASRALTAPGLVNAMPAAEGSAGVLLQAPASAQATSAADDAAPPSRGCCC